MGKNNLKTALWMAFVMKRGHVIRMGAAGALARGKDSALRRERLNGWARGAEMAWRAMAMRSICVCAFYRRALSFCGRVARFQTLL